MKEENPKFSDKELIAAASMGSQEAFRQLYEKYWHDLYKIAYRRLPSEEDVKDILQDTFISLWKNIHHISVKDNLGGYLYVSLRNKILNYYQKNRLRFKSLMNQAFCPVETEEKIYSSLNTKELQLVINTIIAGMPAKMKEIYLLSKEEQLTNAEIARLLTLSPQTVKNQVHNATSRIRDQFKKTKLQRFLFII